MTILNFDEGIYEIEAKFEMLCEIEEELGGLPELAAKFMRDDWKLSELVTITHIALSHIGRNLDYMELGNKILQEGLEKYLCFANALLRSVIYK